MKISIVGCVITDGYERVLLLHSRSDNSSQWELPGGKVEPREVAESVAVLEVRKQLGIDIRLTAHLGSAESEDEKKTFVYQWFQARIIAGTPDLNHAGDFDDFDYFDMEDMMSLSLSAGTQLLLAKIYDGEVAPEPADDV